MHGALRQVFGLAAKKARRVQARKFAEPLEQLARAAAIAAFQPIGAPRSLGMEWRRIDKPDASIEVHDPSLKTALSERIRHSKMENPATFGRSEFDQLHLQNLTTGSFVRIEDDGCDVYYQLVATLSDFIFDLHFQHVAQQGTRWEMGAAYSMMLAEVIAKLHAKEGSGDGELAQLIEWLWAGGAHSASENCPATEAC